VVIIDLLFLLAIVTIHKGYFKTLTKKYLGSHVLEASFRLAHLLNFQFEKFGLNGLGSNILLFIGRQTI